jgi:cytochrome P450
MHQTSVTSVTYCYHFDPVYFPEPETFRPERWLGPDAAQLEARMIAFSRGPRSCIGINLAHAELYLNFGYVFRKFDMRPYKTTAADMEWKDNFVVTTKGHLKVTLSKVDEGAE